MRSVKSVSHLNPRTLTPSYGDSYYVPKQALSEWRQFAGKIVQWNAHVWVDYPIQDKEIFFSEAQKKFFYVREGVLTKVGEQSNRNKRQCVTIGGRIPNNTNGGSGDSNRNVGEGQKRHRVTNKGGRIGGVKVHYYNGQLTTSGTAKAPCLIDLMGSILTPFAGNAQPLHFNGQDYAKIGRGAWAVSDNPLDFPLEPGDNILVRTGVEVPSGQEFVGCSTEALNNSNDASFNHTDSIVPTNPQDNVGGIVHSNGSLISYSPTNKNASPYPLAPAYISGIPETPTPAVLAFGDSNLVGQTDTTYTGAKGFIERAAFDAYVPFANFGRSGASLLAANLGNSADLLGCLKHFSHFLLQMGGNSIGNGDTLATMKQQAVRVLKSAKTQGVETIFLEHVPRTNSDNTTVVAGWEIGGIRDQLNAWGRDSLGLPIDDNGDIDYENGVVLIDHYWDVLTVLHDPETNLWKEASYTTEGVHLTALGAGVGAGYLKSLFEALVV